MTQANLYKFEKLDVWKEALILSNMIYRICFKLPLYERNGLADQIRRSGTSILINIAEGSGAESDREYLRFLHIAKKSLYETVALLKLLNYLHSVKINEELDQIAIVGKLLSGLIRKLKIDSQAKKPIANGQ
jgi:four helix bundle protein